MTVKVLICTHHLHQWAGSELVVLELYEEFRAQGHRATVFSPFVAPKFVHRANGARGWCVNDPARIDLADYDLVLVFHQAASRFLHRQDAALLRGPSRPLFAYFHLSPFEPFEAPGPFAQPLMADIVLANSEETRAHLQALGMTDVDLFPNPAPAGFEAVTPPSETLTTLLSVSNHVPLEMEGAFEILGGQGVDVYRVGKPGNQRRLAPQDLQDHDAVVTIGKTVQAAFRAARPVFCYDIHHGPGWLVGDIAPHARANFSGRSHPVKRGPEALAREILTGYAQARAQAVTGAQRTASCYRLEDHVARLIDWARRTRPRQIDLDAGTLDRQLTVERSVYGLVDREYESHTGVLSPAVPRFLAPPPEHPAISTHLLREPAADEPMIVAVFSYRYEAHLVPGLIENIRGAVHGYVGYDDRAAPQDDVFTDEPARQSALFEAARAMGAEWLLAVDPDERFEDALAAEIRSMTTDYGPVIWSFQCREMFDPSRFRIDGLWRSRSRARLFPCLKGMEPDRQSFHGHWTRNALRLPIKPSGLNFYHLRMATPERRRLRQRQYAMLDSARDSQVLGYDYLDDERGMVLREISPRRGFSPAFEEDGGHWAAPDLAVRSETAPPDPPRSQLTRLKESWAKGGFANATHLACDLLHSHPQDQELMLWAADSAARSDQWQIAADLSTKVAEADAESLMARLILARARAALGQPGAAYVALRQAEALIAGGVICARHRALLAPREYALRQSSAAWRRWIVAPARLIEGAQVRGDSDLTVVVLSLGAPAELERAVASLLEQSVVPEIVVVNSGGGDVLSRLRAYRERLRIITTEARLFAGAARNVGIDASFGRYVAFLASDCTVTRDSLARRQELHRAGARAVSAFVLPEDPGSLSQTVASLLLHPLRHPVSGRLERQKYSLSYDRALFDEFGYFPAGVRIAEDTKLNDAIAAVVEIESDPAICIRHAYASDPDSLLADIAQRSRRRMRQLYFGKVATHQALRKAVNDAYDSRLGLAMQALERRQAELGEDRKGEISALLVKALMKEREAAFEEGLILQRAQDLQREAVASLAEDPAAALAPARAAIELFSGSAAVFQTLADIVLRATPEDPDGEALAALRQAAALEPSNPRVLMRLMDRLIRSGDMTAAVEQFERATLFAPRDPAIWARHAPLPGDVHRPLRVYSLQRTFFLDPMNEGIAKTIAENYRHAGNTAACQARLRLIDLLKPSAAI